MGACDTPNEPELDETGIVTEIGQVKNGSGKSNSYETNHVEWFEIELILSLMMKGKHTKQIKQTVCWALHCRFRDLYEI